MGGSSWRPSRVPVTLYRLQLSPNFTFDAAYDAVSYLHALGVLVQSKMLVPGETR